jgi:DNA polymerase-2
MLLTGRLEDGRSFAAIRTSPGPAVFVRRDLAGEAGAALGLDCFEDWSDMGGHALARFRLEPGGLRLAERALRSAGIAEEGLDRGRAEDELASLGIRGPVVLRGEEKRGRRVDAVFVEPEIEASAGFAGSLRWLALDIETDRSGSVVAVSLAEGGKPGEVLFVPLGGHSSTVPGVEAFPDEASLLGALAARLARRDPDVITGWNVIDFDLMVIIERCKALGISFDAGRTEEPASFSQGSRPSGKAVLDLPGRAAIDAMRLARGSGARYDDLSLETVAREVLGEGKTVSSRDEEKIDELDRLRLEDPGAFCAYCLRDSELVLRILAETGLAELTMRRAALTGVALDLAWTSIPAFERVYGAALRARHVAVPPKTERRVSGAAGGTVLEASAGLFPKVLVFDFRSLYPSIMRTFNVDPLAYERAAARAPRNEPAQIASMDGQSAAISSPQNPIIASGDDIAAPNGARFDREEGVMPGLSAEYSAEREKALERGDAVAAYVYKILQNSFYGVLGAEGCRYARTEIAGAITSFGKKFLVMARDFFEERGQRVLYGDTDSVFVLSGEEGGFARLSEAGAAAAEALNAEIARRVREEYGLESYVRIRCDKVYERLVIPRLKAAAGEGGRGRSKGYAGLLLAPDGSSSVEIKGMEAARSDFTPLARDFQVALIGLVFSGAGESALRDFCRSEEAALMRGERDGKLVYRKTLRRLAQDYESETPQVRAARIMGWGARRGRVSYVMTKAGPEPALARGASLLDYDHYVEKQLFPIALSIADALGYDARAWMAGSAQIELDFGE